MLRFFHRNYLWLAGIAAGAIWCLQLPGRWIYWALLLALSAYLTVKRCCRELVILFLAVSAGLICSYWHLSDMQPERDCRLENVPVQVNDHNAMGSPDHDDDLSAYRLCGRIVSGEIPGNIQLYLPRRLGKIALESGRTYQVSGNFYAPELPAEFLQAGADGSWRDVTDRFVQNSYKVYLQQKNIRGTLVVDSCKELPGRKSRMLQWRKMLQQRLDKGLDDPEHRAILGAVTLGFRSRLPSAEKDAYARVGIAHIFSVSGMHVGILALLLLAIIRPLPMICHVLAVSTLFFYVLTTGGEAPALRALALVIAVEFFRMKLLWVRPLELLSLIAGGFILCNPYYIIDVGFQYSFVVTALLLVSVEAAREAVRSGQGVQIWWGEINWFRRWLLNCRGKFYGALLIAVTACTASWSLSLYHQKMFFAGAILANMLLVAALSPLFAAAVAKCVLPVFAEFWNIFLKLILNYLQWLVAVFEPYANAPEVIAPHWIVPVVLLVLAVLLIRLRTHFLALLPALGMGVTVLLLQVYGAVQPPQQAVVISGGGLTNPVAAVLLTHSHSMYVLNCGKDAVYALKEVADYYGITGIQQLDIGRPSVDCVDGLKFLQRNFPINVYRRTPQKVRSSAYRKFTDGLPMQPAARENTLSIAGETLRIEPQSSGVWQVFYRNKVYTLERTARVRVHLLEN